MEINNQKQAIDEDFFSEMIIIGNIFKSKYVSFFFYHLTLKLMKIWPIY